MDCQKLPTCIFFNDQMDQMDLFPNDHARSKKLLEALH
jgi:hypothetical protein